jgi:hypothetical protein
MLDRSGAPIWVDFDDGTSKEMSGRQLYDYIFEPKNHLCITANGTIFKTKTEGIIPQLLEKWYVERQTMQGMKKAFASITKDGLKLPSDIADAVSAKLESG